MKRRSRRVAENCLIQVILIVEGFELEKVSVILSTYSKTKLPFVMNCVESMEKQSLKPDEVLLVLDPNPDLVQFYKDRMKGRVKIVVSNSYGLSNARNAGIRNACGTIVAFIDDDAVADEDWLLNHVKDFEDPHVISVGGKIKPLWEANRPPWFAEELDWIVGCSYKGLPEHRAIIRNPIGCNMSFRKSAFAAAGFFRSDIGRFGKMLLAGEEPELAMRILRKIPDAKILYDPTALVYHRVGKNRAGFGYMWKRSFFEGVSKALIVSEKQQSTASLSAEDTYLKHLLGKAIPSRLKRFYKPAELSQSAAMILSSGFVFLGFVFGRLMSKRT